MLASAAVLLLVGIMAVYTSSSFRSLLLTDSESSTVFLLPHVLKVLVGLAFGVLAYLLPVRLLRALAMPLYLSTLVMLAAVLLLKDTRWAPVINGSARWLVAGGFRLMPSELARVTFVLVAASMVSAGRLRARSVPGVVRLSALALFPAVLVSLQPDYVGALYLFTILVVMLFLAEARFRDILVLLLVAAALASALALSSPYRRERLATFFSPGSADEASSYQPHQACVALGSGGLMGRGIGRGRQQRGFLPEASSDYILAVIGEETGFVGSVTVLGLALVMILSGWVIADGSDNIFGFLAAGGLMASIAVGMLIHVSVVTRMAPATGMTFPLVSWGGSSILVTLVSLGVTARIAEDGGGR